MSRHPHKKYPVSIHIHAGKAPQTVINMISYKSVYSVSFSLLVTGGGYVEVTRDCQ